MLMLFASLMRVLSTAAPEGGLETNSWFGLDRYRKYRIYL